MAKQVKDDGKEIKDMLQKLFKAVQVMSSASEEQRRISKELMKVMSLLNSGFVDSADDANKLIDTIRDNGFSLTDGFIKKWAKARKATDEDLKNIVKRFKEIDDLSDDVIDSAEDYTELLEEQIGSIEETLDLSTKLLNGHKKITQAVAASKKEANALAGSMGDVSSLTDKILQKKVDITGMFSGMFSGMEEGKLLVENIRTDIDSLIARAGNSDVKVNLMFNPLSEDLDREVKKMLDSIDEAQSKNLQGLKEYYGKNTDLQDKLAKSMAAQEFAKDIKFDIDTSDIVVGTTLLKQGTAEYQTALDRLSKIVSDNNLGERVNTNLSNMIKFMTTGNELSEEQNIAAKEYFNQLGDTNKLIANQFDARLQDLSALKEDIIREKSRLTIIGQYTNQLSAARTIVTKIGEGFNYISGLLPSGVSDFFGISKISQSLLDAHVKGVEKFSSHVSEGGELAKGMSVYMAEIGPSIKMALNPMLLLVAAGALLFNTLQTVVATYKDMASSMKISIKQAKDLHQVGLDTLTSQKNQFATMDDIQTIQSEMIESGKSIYSLNTKGAKELAISLSDVGKAFGYGTQQAAQLQNVFTQIGASDDLALSLQTDLGFMTEMAGLSPQIISQDLLDGAEQVSTYFGGLPEKAKDAVLGIRKMGMSLRKAGEIAKSTLDLEAFMTNMYELQAMTGGGVDLSGVFEKGLMGDLEGMTKEIMNQMGTTAEFSKQDYKVKMKIANTLGMSVDELTKSVQLNEQISQFSGLEKEALEANKDRLGDISKLNKEQVRDRLQQLQSTDRLGIAWDKIKGVLLSALIPLAESFAGAIDGLSPIIDIVVIALKGVGAVIKLLAPLIQGMLFPLQIIGWVIDKITSKLDDWLGTLKPLDTTITLFGYKFDAIKDTIYGIGILIGSWAMLTKMPAILGSVAGVFKTILSFIPGVSTLLGSLTGGLGGIFGGMGKKAEEATKKSTDPVVSMTTNIKNSMVSMIDSIKSAMDGMVSHIKNSVSSAGDAISKGLNKSPTQKMMEEIKKEGVSTSKTLSSEAAKSASDMKEAMTDGAKVSTKKLKEIKAEGIGLVPKAAVKSSFGFLVEVGTKSLAALAAKTATSYLFATKEGEQALGGFSGEIQGMIQMAAIGGSSYLVDILQDSLEKVFTKRFEKRIEGGVGKIGGMVSKKITGGFDAAGTSGQGMFSKVGAFGKSIFEKMSTFTKSLFPKSDKGIEESVTKQIVSGDIAEKITTPKVPTIEIPEAPVKTVEKTGSIFKTLADVIKSAWSTIKSTVLDIVKFIGDALKSITGAIGKSIENLLKGIGNGLSSFKNSAVKGAAALVLVSGALWITSKALENFANVSWTDIAKGVLTLGALVGAAMLLGKISGQVLTGAAAIAMLGASLIPAAFALNMFNDVEWGSLGKAGLSLLGLAAVGSVLGGMLPMMLMGALGIAALGAAMIPMAFSMKMFNDIEWGSLGKAAAALIGFGAVAAGFAAFSVPILVGAGVLAIASTSLLAFAGSIFAINIAMKGLDVSPIKGLVEVLVDITGISIMSLLGVAGGIAAISASMAALSMIGLGSSVAKLFGGDVIKDLERIAVLSEPLNAVNQVISQLAASIMELSDVLGKADFDSIQKLNDIDVKSLDQDVNQKINTVSGQVQNYSEPSVNYKIAPQQPQTAEAMNPKKESVAQNVNINNLPGTKNAGDGEESYGASSTSTQNSYYGDNGSESNIYNRPGMDTKKLEMLLMRLIQLNEMALQKSTVVQMNGQKVGVILKKENNK